MPNEEFASRLLSSCWQEFVRSIPRGGRVLDLGTGLGYVLKEIGRERTDVELIGVDSVESLAPDDPRLRIFTGVMMERLPFEMADFDSICSQFGFEYSDMAATAHEIARVLRPGGTVQLLVHHSDGAIVRQSARRRAALEWIFERSDIFERSGRLLDECHALAGATLDACREAVVSAAQQHLDQVAIEVAAAVHRMIAIGPRTWAKQAGSELDRLSDHARNELVMLAAIERVSIDADGIENIMTLLRDVGLSAAPPRIVEAQAGVPFAWLLSASVPGKPGGTPRK